MCSAMKCLEKCVLKVYYERGICGCVVGESMLCVYCGGVNMHAVNDNVQG